MKEEPEGKPVSSLERKREGELPVGEVPALKALSDCLTENQRKELKLTPAEIKRLVAELEEKVYWGPAASLPMLCTGPKCPVAASCSLQQIKRAPVGSRCPVELVMLNKWKDDYLESLGADWGNKIERQAIMDLVETEVFRSRANGIIAAEGFVMENVIGYDQDTKQEITTKIKHIALDVSDQLTRRQERLLKSLIATREMKEKLGQGKKDRSIQESDIMEKVRAAMAKEKKSKEVIREGEIVGENSKKNFGPPPGTQKAPEDGGAGAAPGGDGQ